MPAKIVSINARKALETLGADIKTTRIKRRIASDFSKISVCLTYPSRLTPNNITYKVTQNPVKHFSNVAHVLPKWKMG